jgi:putative (di)nucleoside polyphosphate hydrolase
LSDVTKAAEGLPYRPCVGIMLVNPQGLVFIGKRAGAPDQPEGIGTWWQMPQGGMDAGEEPKQAARRELAEETSVSSAHFIARTRDWHHYDLPAHLIGVAWEGRYRGQKQLWFAARFLGHDSEIDLAPQPGHAREFDAWQWAPLEALPGLVVPFKRPVYERVIAELAPHIANGA